MALKIIFNPLSGKFDYIDVASGFAPTTPTTFQEDLNISEFIQMLFRQHMVIGSYSVIIGTDASLIGV